MGISVIQSDTTSEIVVSKHHNSDIVLGSQIIVRENEEAIIVENGQILTSLKAGRHTVESGNIPGLKNLIERSFNGGSPIKVEIWFFNKVANFDFKWGSQINLQDKKYNLLVPLGIRGSYTIRICDTVSFLKQMVGSESLFTKVQLQENLLPNVLQVVKDITAEEVEQNNADIYTLATELIEISEKVKNNLIKNISKFGLELIDFFIIGIDVISDDPSFKKIQESLSEAAALRVKAKAVKETGDFYKLERSLDALNKASENENGMAGNLLSGGLGIGLGVGVGQQMGNSLKDSTSFQSNEQNQSSDDIFIKIKNLKSLLESGLITQEEFDKKRKELLDKY